MITKILLLLLTYFACSRAHISLWHPSQYGFNYEGNFPPSYPMAKLPFSSWWFHGQLDQPLPSEVMSIPAGKTMTVELSCAKRFTSWGKDKQGNVACPNDAGSYHAGGRTGDASGWGANSDGNLKGCALAIAFKKDAKSVKPEDFTIFSIQTECVRFLQTPFEVPKNIPACPEGECTCAWFWGGKNSAAEMYMTGFRCNVEGGVKNGQIPTPAKPSKIHSGPVQPFFWANQGGQNWQGSSAEPWDTERPSYDSNWGFKNGAQTVAFAAANNDATSKEEDASNETDSDRATSNNASSDKASSSEDMSKQGSYTDSSKKSESSNDNQASSDKETSSTVPVTQRIKKCRPKK